MNAPAAFLLVFATAVGPLICSSAEAQDSPAAAAGQISGKLAAGCNKALLDGDFSLSKAPDIPCKVEQKAFIDDTARADYEKRGFPPLKATVVRETGK